MLIGLDIGTTNVKAVAVDDAGSIVAASERRNETLQPRPGFSEQDPESVYRNVEAVLVDVAGSTRGEALHGAVLSSAMHGLVAVDRGGKPLCNIMLWSDLRADGVANRLKQGGEGMSLYSRTGVPVHAMSPLAKLIWLRENRPDIFRKTYKFLGIKDFVWFRMTGLYEVDLSVASATGLMNIHEKRWDSEALAVAGISGEQLPLIVPTTRSITLPSGIALYIGASDGALANVGSGAVAPGAVAVTIGTSAAIRTVVPAPVLDDRMRSFCYCLDAERYIAGGASNNGTNVLEWLRNDVFRSPLAAAAFVDSAAEAPPGADGLLFFPWMFGERAPLYDAQARGAYFGLSAAHGQAHFVRAALEGIVFNLRLVGEVLESKAAVRMLYASGGFSHNSLWVSILADIFQKPVVLSGDGADASVWGAVQLGRAASGMPLLPAGASERVVEPNEKNAAIYGEIYGRFRQMALRDTTFAAG